MTASIGHATVPYWMGMTGEWVSICTCCKQGAPDSPLMWHILLDEALGPFVKA